MKAQEVLQTYNENYARSYNERFLLADHAKMAFESEVRMIATLLGPEANWLDVACGTGLLLSRFEGVRRGGLDLSPAMLAQARTANPDALFLRQGDFRDTVTEWENEWMLVTCMWYAYGLVESMTDVARVVHNMARWTSERGTCFVPVWDPKNLSKQIRIPYALKDKFYGGEVRITGLTWSWIEESGARHENMIAPHIEHMVEMFEEHFETVEVVSYRLSPSWRSPRRKAIKATQKRKR